MTVWERPIGQRPFFDPENIKNIRLGEETKTHETIRRISTSRGTKRNKTNDPIPSFHHSPKPPRPLVTPSPSFLSPPLGFFIMRAMISVLGAALQSLSCPSPSWSPHRNDRKNEAGSRAVRRRPPRPVLIRGFVPGGLIEVVSRGMGCVLVGR